MTEPQSTSSAAMSHRALISTTKLPSTALIDAEKKSIKPRIQYPPEKPSMIIELSDYEKLRERNIQERKALFQQLDINKSKWDASNANKDGWSKENSCREGCKRSFEEFAKEIEKCPNGAYERMKENLRPRRSLRRISIDSETPILNKQYTSQFVTNSAAYIQKCQKRFNSLELSEMTSSKENMGKLQYISSYFDTLAQIITKEDPIPVDVSVEKMGMQLKEIEIDDKSFIKVTSSRISSLAVHPSRERLFVSVGDKQGNIGFIDVDTLTSKSQAIIVLSPHYKRVNCLTFDDYDNAKMHSCSDDGTLRTFDLKKQISTVAHTSELEHDNDRYGYLTYHCQRDPSTFFVSGALKNNIFKQSKGIIGLVDIRCSNKRLESTYNVFSESSHSRSQMVAVHPIVKDMFAAAGGWNGSECKIFDIRHTQENKGLMKPVDEQKGHTGLISSICFSPVSGSKIATICTDKRMRIYEVGKNQTAPNVVMYLKTHSPFNDNLVCGLQAVWHPKREDLLVVGSMKRPRRINIISDKGIPHPPLEIANMESICSLVKCHPSQNIVVGGSNLGNVHVFM